MTGNRDSRVPHGCTVACDTFAAEINRIYDRFVGSHVFKHTPACEDRETWNQPRAAYVRYRDESNMA